MIKGDWRRPCKVPKSQFDANWDAIDWGDDGKMVIHSCLILCPECGGICQAEVEQLPGEPFATYLHECEYCEYVIMESDWEEVS